MKQSRWDNPYFLMTILYILWGSLAAVSKLALGSLDNYQVQFYSFGSGFVFFTALLAANGKLKALFAVKRRAIVRLLLLGVPFYLYSLLYSLSFNRISVVEASMLNYLFPVLIVLLSVPLLGERMTAGKTVSILLGFTGMLLIVTSGNLTEIRLSNVGGDLLALGAAASWAIYSVLGKKDGTPPELALYMHILSAFALSFVCMLAFSSFAAPDAASLGLTAWMGISSTVLGNLLWLRGLKSSSASLIASLSYLTPFVTLLFIVALLGETIRLPQLAGFLVILAGVAVQVLAERKGAVRPLPERENKGLQRLRKRL